MALIQTVDGGADVNQASSQRKGQIIMKEFTTTPMDRKVLAIVREWSDKEFEQAFGFPRIPMVRHVVRFDDTQQDWHKDPGYNQTFLANQQSYANQLLLRRGHLFLNDVFDLLKMNRTRFGQTSGWTVNLIDGKLDFGFSTDDEFMSGFTCDVDLVFYVRENLHLILPD
jgi:hypothetical protein